MANLQIVSDEQINAAGVELATYCEHVEAALLALRNEELSVTSKSTLARQGLYASSCHAAWWTRGRFFFHNLYGSDVRLRDKGAHYRSTQLLVCTESLEPDLQIVGSTVSTMVPVAVTCLAAKRLAKADSTVLGLVGSGLQARLHMTALKTLFPLSDVVVYTRSAETFESFLSEAQKLGLSCSRAESPQHAVATADIVVSSISDSIGIQPFLSLSWLQPGTFLSSVDLFRPWENGHNAPRFLVADDRAQLTQQISDKRVPDCGKVDASLADILAGEHVIDDRPRVLVHPGCAATLFGIAEAIRSAVKAASTST